MTSEEMRSRSEWWHVVGMDAYRRALYSANVVVELNPEYEGLGATAAIRVASERLAQNGYDPRIVHIWHVEKTTAPQYRREDS